jgi:hypothetical protein
MAATNMDEGKIATCKYHQYDYVNAFLLNWIGLDAESVVC